MNAGKLFSFAAAACLAFQTLPAAGISAEETASADTIMYGDINGNNVADITDLSLLSLYLINDITLEGRGLNAADTDGNGEVNLGDLAHFRMFLSKLPVKLGPQEEVPLKLRPAADYDEINSLIETANRYDYYGGPDVGINGVDKSEPTVSAPSVEDSPVSKNDYSVTYNQEENVLEADKVKTDGNAIFSLSFNIEGQTSLNAVYADDGKFKSAHSYKLDLKENRFGLPENIHASDMYLYNDRIIVLGTAYFTSEEKPDDYYPAFYGLYRPFTFVSVFTKGTEDQAPELIDTYYQEGRFRDVRITPDGFMYLVSNGNFFRTDNESRIPLTGTNSAVTPVKCSCIYIPAVIDETCSRSYTVAGSIDLNSSDKIKESDVKVIAGYSGEIYCCEKNLYLTHKKYNYILTGDTGENNALRDENNALRTREWSVTEITRASLSEGKITPEATGEVQGYIKDQFSMSEYKGYFRIVTTSDTYSGEKYGSFRTERSNNIYILDQNLNKTGEITGFARDESVKSVSFDGDTGYIVTYVQTDPLFAFDLSDPSDPVMLDEFKIDGYSTYMQKWDEGKLLGFGVSTYTNEYGGEVRDGFKLVMFDNSDPENLSAEGVYKVLNSDKALIFALTDTPAPEPGQNAYLSSCSSAERERKALLIAPEKNLIGFPLYFAAIVTPASDEDYCSEYDGGGYLFFSYDNGEFTLKNFLGDVGEAGSIYSSRSYSRAVYIGDYVYIISDGKLISADIDTCTETDSLTLK